MQSVVLRRAEKIRKSIRRGSRCKKTKLRWCATKGEITPWKKNPFLKMIVYIELNAP